MISCRFTPTHRFLAMPHRNTLRRPPAVAGQFYSDSPEALSDQIERWLRIPSEVSHPNPPKLLIVPHAGYLYSGAIAASAYALLRLYAGRVRRVILLGPAHRVAVNGLAMPSVGAFSTPLGDVPLDSHALELIRHVPQVVVSDPAHDREHSLEVQLPFLQKALGDFTLVPLVVGDATPRQVAEVLEVLWGGDETLIVISSDLSHFLDYDQARRRDQQTVQRILNRESRLDPYDACGAYPVNGALLAATRHGLKPVLLNMCNSGDITGDHSRVVGYAALAFWPEPTGKPKEDTGTADSDRCADLGPALLTRARNAIASRLGLPLREEPYHPALREPGATFVTLHHRGRLRGCMGRLVAGEDSLESDVRRNAHRAAFEDPRFQPLTLSEWSGLEVEVSLLGAPRILNVSSEAEALSVLRPGVDGLIFGWRHYRGTFLPQVWAQLPDGREFLAALKRKAGLPEDFWAEDVELARYEVRLFQETGEVGA